jgi:hypothetical protein
MISSMPLVTTLALWMAAALPVMVEKMFLSMMVFF